MSDSDNGGLLRKLKPVYSFLLGAAVALGGERLIYYLRDKYNESREKDIEEMVERIVKKYKEADQKSG